MDQSSAKNETSVHGDSDERDFLFAADLVLGAVLPMVLKSAIELDLLELIKKAGLNAYVSAAELVAQLPVKDNPDAVNMVDRILKFLSAHSVLTFCYKPLSNDVEGGLERRYALAPVCKFLTKNDEGVSMNPMSLMINDKVFMETWYHLKDVVLEGGSPFKRAHGMSEFQYSATDSRVNKLFNKAMSDQSILFTKKIIEIYKGFDGLKSLVDVGGGDGTTINMIVSRYPSIKGINFDLPHVVHDAPSYQGVTHLSGDMFVRVPEAEAIFMKWICHDWTNDQCEKLLRNCYEALPRNGKVIIAEFILPEDPNSEIYFSQAARADMLMMAHTPGGKERTEKEFETLAKRAGFQKFHKVCCAFNMWIMELCK